MRGLGCHLPGRAVINRGEGFQPTGVWAVTYPRGPHDASRGRVPPHKCGIFHGGTQYSPAADRCLRMFNFHPDTEGILMTRHPYANPRVADKAQRLLARLRDRQLHLAIAGRIDDSARYAARATRVRRLSRGAVAA